jgi:hypothetical protein
LWLAISFGIAEKNSEMNPFKSANQKAKGIFQRCLAELTSGTGPSLNWTKGFI